VAPDALALGRAEARERLGHEVVADPEQRERALQALQIRRRMPAHGEYRPLEAEHLGLLVA
jgi:hypothetical protein